jgi:transcriptional regulator with XRE-family HTH domain
MRMTTGGQARDTEPARSGPNTERFNEWLQTELKARKMSQRQLANKSGVSHSSISRLVLGGRVPSLRTALSLARAIDQADHDPSEFRPGPVGGANAAARVEYALRADDALNETGVREIMLHYLAMRMGRPGSSAAEAPVTAHRSRRDPLVPTVAQAPGAQAPSKPSDRRRAYHRS